MTLIWLPKQEGHREVAFFCPNFEKNARKIIAVCAHVYQAEALKHTYIINNPKKGYAWLSSLEDLKAALQLSKLTASSDISYILNQCSPTLDRAGMLIPKTGKCELISWNWMQPVVKFS